jgi:uncharacterized phage-associated protein
MKIEFDDANTVALYFLSKKPMSQKKMHKLLYYAYSWYLYIYNEKEIENVLFKNNFCAWIHGPVYTTLYSKYRDFGMNLIEYTGEVNISNTEIKDFLNDILDRYGNFTANELENMSHNESPWINSRVGIQPNQISRNKIKDDEILSFMYNEYD